MSDADARPLDLEALLNDALRPVEPPESLSERIETTLTTITEQAAAHLSSWADELSATELASLRDPRNWVRPVVAGVADGAGEAQAASPSATATDTTPERPSLVVATAPERPKLASRQAPNGHQTPRRVASCGHGNPRSVRPDTVREPRSSGWLALSAIRRQGCG